MAADGTVKIDVELIVAQANAAAKTLDTTLNGIGTKSNASAGMKELDTALKQTTDSAKSAAAATKADTAANDQNATATKKTAEATKTSADAKKKNVQATREDESATKQASTAQKTLSVSLEAQSKYWQQLADAQDKAGLKTSSQVSHLNSLKAQLAQTAVATEQATQKLKDEVIATDSGSESSRAAASSLAVLQSKQAALGMETASLSKKLGGLSPAMAASIDKANALGNKMQSAGEKISSVGNKMTIGLSAPIAAGFALAGKAAVTFDSEIQSMGALLDDGTVSASTLKAELNKLGSASKSWSTEYGVSTSSINSGMSELIKKGYSYNQVLGAMPSILDAARASGDDFNSVMSVSTSVLEQFGLKSNNTATMLKNTQRVTDSLSYVANKTSAGFGDMGEAMEYVGPVANGLHMSLEQTAAAIGLMSNQGIEGEKAGTALRGALSQLMNPSKQNEIGFKRLGISIKDFKNGSIGLPEILDSVKKSSKGMTAQQLQSNLALAFGTEAVSGMNILVNEGGDALRNMTKETKGATGYTKKLAETMNNTAQANVEKFKSSLNVLAITAGQKLLPQITELVKSGTDLVKWFNDLDDGTQKTILKALALTAAVGPLLSGIGKMSTGVGALVHGGTSAVTFLSRFASGAGKTKTESELLGEMFDLLKGKTGTVATGLETATGAVAKTGAGMAAAETGSAGFLASLAPIAPALIGVGVAAAAGVAYWELYGKEAQASSERTSRWGTDIGAAADKSAGKMADASGKISGAFTDTNHTVQENAKTIVTGFDSMTAAAKKAATESNTAAEKLAKSLGGSAGAALLAAASKEKTANDKRIKQMQTYSKQAEQITSDANKKGEALTADQIQVLDNLRQASAAQAVKTMQLSGKEQNNVLKAILGEKVTMSQASAQKQYENMQDNLQKEYQAESKVRNEINKNDQLTTAEKNAAIEGLEKDHQSKLNVIYQGAIQAMKAQGLSNTEIQQKLQSDFDLSASKAKAALTTYTNAMSKAANSQNQFAVAVSDGMSKAVKGAATAWNSLVLDPKTGKVKTNAQEEVDKAVKSKDSWNSMELLIKKGQMTQNGNEMIAQALISQKRWDDLDFITKKAKLNDETKEAIASALISNGKWNSKDWKTAQLLATNKTNAGVISALADMGRWDDLTPKQQQMIAQAKTKDALAQALHDTNSWDSLKPKQQIMLALAHTSAAVKSALSDMGQWDTLTPKEKNMLAHAKTAADLKKALKDMDMWNGLPTKVKNMIAEDLASGPATSATRAVNAFPTGEKRMKLITELATIHEDSRNWSDADRQAMGFRNGTSYFGGGLAMVNDQAGSMYREAIVSPRGFVYSYAARNAIVPVERGSEIIPASKSYAAGLVPHYANGTGGQLTDAIDRAALSPIWSMTAESASSFQPLPEKSEVTVHVDNKVNNDEMVQAFNQSIAQMQRFMSQTLTAMQHVQINAVATMSPSAAARDLGPYQSAVNAQRQLFTGRDLALGTRI